MAEAEQATPSFKRAVAKRALAPVVASVSTAATTFLMRKGAQLWQERLQPKVEEQGGAEALGRKALEAVSRAVAPVSETAAAKVTHEDEPAPEASAHDDRDDERRERERRRAQRRKALEQAGSS